MAAKSPITLSGSVLVPAGTILLAVSATVGVCKWAFGRDTDQAQLKAQVNALDARVTKAESRLDKGDERWDQIRESLSQIKERLGIVEAKSPAAHP